MNGGPRELETLTRTERVALRSLLLHTTRAAGRSDRVDHLAELARAAPISALPAAAALHRVSGTVLRGLENVPGVPDQVRAELGGKRDKALMQHLRTLGPLSQIARAFDSAGLAWVVMKGPVVAAMLYPEVGDRSYGDLDLLLDRRDFPEGMSLLEELGYLHTTHDWAHAERVLAGEVEMTSPLISVDLHCHLHYSHVDRQSFALDPSAMLRRARRIDISGVSVPTFDPVDTLLTLGFHAARSDGHRLIWFKDVERSLAVDQPDLDELVRRCRTARCAPSVGIVLGRARRLLDADVPDQVLGELVPSTLRAADRVACAIVHPIQMHERSTLARVYTRSVRSSTAETITAVPPRVVRLARTMLHPPQLLNETDDPIEKAGYLRAVSESVNG